MNTPSKWPCTASASAVTFCEVPVSQLPTTSMMLNLLPAPSMTSRKPRWRSRSTELPGRPRTSRMLPDVLPHFVQEPFGRHAAHLLLVLVDHHHLVGVEDVVEGHHHDVVLVGEADDAVEAVGRHRDGDDGVEALIDEVLDGAELRRDVGAGRDDLELLDVLLDARLLGEGLGGLDHLDAPGVADEAVDEGDLVGSGLLVPLEELGLVGPGLEASGIGARPGDDLGACRSTDRG